VDDWSLLEGIICYVGIFADVAIIAQKVWAALCMQVQIYFLPITISQTVRFCKPVRMS